jgi:hypothetical protein
MFSDTITTQLKFIGDLTGTVWQTELPVIEIDDSYNSQNYWKGHESDLIELVDTDTYDNDRY